MEDAGSYSKQRTELGFHRLNTMGAGVHCVPCGLQAGPRVSQKPLRDLQGEVNQAERALKENSNALPCFQSLYLDLTAMTRSQGS